MIVIYRLGFPRRIDRCVRVGKEGDTVEDTWGMQRWTTTRFPLYPTAFGRSFRCGGGGGGCWSGGGGGGCVN